MENNLRSDFIVDKSSKTVTIIREFNARQSLVWDTFTKPELMDEWGAPDPFKAVTKHMEFKAGGKRLYAMVSPEGTEMFSLQQYTSVSPITNFKYTSSFCDKDGISDPKWPGSQWDLTFSERRENDSPITKVVILIYNESLERMEKMIEMGFREGFMMTMENLIKVLARYTKK